MCVAEHLSALIFSVLIKDCLFVTCDLFASWSITKIEISGIL